MSAMYDIPTIPKTPDVFRSDSWPYVLTVSTHLYFKVQFNYFCYSFIFCKIYSPIIKQGIYYHDYIISFHWFILNIFCLQIFVFKVYRRIQTVPTCTKDYDLQHLCLFWSVQVQFRFNVVWSVNILDYNTQNIRLNVSLDVFKQTL